MSRKRKPPTNAKAAAKAAHEKFLRKHGIDPSRKPRLRGAVASPLDVKPERQAPTVPTSDRIPGAGPQDRRPQKPKTHFGIAQVYHKGPLMVVTNFADLEGSKRRD